MKIVSANITGSLILNGTDVSSITGSQSSIDSLNSKTGSYATTGSNSFTGGQNISGSVAITGSLTTTGTITAQTLNVQQVTSSVVYSSGSNVFGNSLSNTQVMTGSVSITGSLGVNGPGTFSGVVTSDDLILTAGTLFGAGNTGLSNRSSDGILYLQMPANGFNITDNGLNTKVQISSTGAATFSGNGAFNTTSAVSGYSLDVRAATNKRMGVANSNSLSGANLLFYTDTNAFADGYIDATKLILQSQSGGNVGIGTTSPKSYTGYTVLTVGNSSNNGGILSFRSTYNSGDGAEIFQNTNGDLFFNTNSSSTSAVIKANGNTLIGTTTDAGYKLDVNGAGRFSGNVVIGSSSPSTKFEVQEGFISTYHANNNPGAGYYIKSYTNTTGSTKNEIGGFGILQETINERSGKFFVDLYNNGTLTTPFVILKTGAATFSSLGTGTVYSNGGTLTNTNPSDLNLKTNIEDITYGLNEILQLKPKSYLWKEDKINQGKQFGFIAQDVQEVIPELVKDGEYLGLDKEAIFVILVNAIKELKAENDTLKEILTRNNIN